MSLCYVPGESDVFGKFPVTFYLLPTDLLVYTQSTMHAVNIIRVKLLMNVVSFKVEYKRSWCSDWEMFMPL